MKILKWSVAAAAFLLLAATVAIFATSQWARARTYDVALRPAPASARPDGARLATAFGCRDCHGTNGQGGILVDDAALGRLVAPSLARAATVYSDDEFARVIRRGVKRDGTGVLVMPSPAFSHLADEDLGAIIGWIRTLRPSKADVTAQTRFGPLGRVLLATGKLRPNVVTDAPIAPAKRPSDTGAYIYASICSDCHALYHDRPAPEGTQTVPALAAVAASYDRQQFLHLFRTGRGVGNRDLGLMSSVARKAFSAFTDEELIATQDYLARRAAEQPSG